jgi:D-isomer specific 2-hydroxyacid dehydrogenase, catalytic domain
VSKFRVALSGDYLRPDGSAAFPDFDLAPLHSNPLIEIGYVAAETGIIPAGALEDYDALILFAFQMRRSSLPANRRLGLIARLGVGYDSVDVEALADEGVATVITPGGVARPVAVGILTFILHLAAKSSSRMSSRGEDPRGSRSAQSTWVWDSPARRWAASVLAISPPKWSGSCNRWSFVSLRMILTCRGNQRADWESI